MFDPLNQNHPGIDAGDCELRITISGRRTDGGAGGFACSFSGGHCLPGSDCDRRRAEEANMKASMPVIEEMQ